MKCGNSAEYWTLRLNWSYLEINEKNIFFYPVLEVARERCIYLLLRMWIYYEKHTVKVYRIVIKKARSGHCFCWRFYDFMNPFCQWIMIDIHKLENVSDRKHQRAGRISPKRRTNTRTTALCVSCGALIKIRKTLNFVPNLAQAVPLKPRPGWAMS